MKIKTVLLFRVTRVEQRGVRSYDTGIQSVRNTSSGQHSRINPPSANTTLATSGVAIRDIYVGALLLHLLLMLLLRRADWLVPGTAVPGTYSSSTAAVRTRLYVEKRTQKNARARPSPGATPGTGTTHPYQRAAARRIHSSGPLGAQGRRRQFSVPFQPQVKALGGLYERSS